MHDTTIKSLGECHHVSPLRHTGGHGTPFRQDTERVLYDNKIDTASRPLPSDTSFEVAGPREMIYFDPPKVTAAIVTCGGLCPGLNDIIRGIVTQLSTRYGTTRIYGFKYGYEGLVSSFGHAPMVLRPESVAQIGNFGGTILGSSRGPQKPSDMVDMLEEMNVDQLYVVGGDGTLRGAIAINEEIRRRGLDKVVVGIPKTIDNDIMYLDKCFGFETAFAHAVQAIRSTQVEAAGGYNGIGILKLMGRDSGFIACFAALAGSNVDFVLIPEVDFDLEGSAGLLEALHYRVAKRKHAVIVVSEGAGQRHVSQITAFDASGNKKYGDIGAYLRERIAESFQQRRIPCTLKYIDPSYLIRSVPANPQDNVYCSQLAQHAVHAAMAGKTGMIVGRWHCAFVHLPLELVTQGRKKVDPQGDLWHSVLQATGQPPRLM